MVLTVTLPRAALLLLTDGRFPAGGYAHSGGLEPTITAGRVHDLPTLEAFLTGRACTAGAVAAAFAAAACGAVADDDLPRLEALDSELDARMPSPTSRATSRQLGRQFLRTVEQVRPRPPRVPLGADADGLNSRGPDGEHGLGPTPHLPVALGAACAWFGLGRRDAAVAALHDSVAGPAAAAVRLLSINPFGAHAALARLAPLLDDLAGHAVQCSHGGVADLPAASAPLLDIGAEQHAARSMRLFAS